MGTPLRTGLENGPALGWVSCFQGFYVLTFISAGRNWPSRSAWPSSKCPWLERGGVDLSSLLRACVALGEA